MTGVARALDRTHDSSARSWIESANGPGHDFPLQNLPFGVFTRRGDGSTPPAIGVAIGDAIIDLRAVAHGGLIDGLAPPIVAACRAEILNPLMELRRPAWVALRARLHALLRAGDEETDRHRDRVATCLLSAGDAVMQVPACIGDYTDFYASVHHATNVGRMMRPDNPLLPNYKWVPIGYHGRASSIVVSGTPVRRPVGQTRPEGAERPVVGPSARLDYELEVAAFIGPGNGLGTPIALGDADDHVFGICLLNDWSARDIQAWEYQPLGPFVAKNFATTISPWVVTIEALRPFRVPLASRPPDDPPLLPYLDHPWDRALGGLALSLEVQLSTRLMRERGDDPVSVSRGDFTRMYWTFGQMVAHHTAGGCNLRPGDLLASGTVSGPEPSSRGCLLELTWRGTQPLALPTGETRRFLEDGDEVIFRGRAEAPGAVGLGLSECRGAVAGRGGGV